MTAAFGQLVGLGAFCVLTAWGILRGLDWLGRCDADDYL